MFIKSEPFGFTVEVDRQGRAPVKLTFEEIYGRKGSNKKYYCCVDVGLYAKQGNRLVFKEMGSFEIQDWFNERSELTKRSKLRKLLGVTVYRELCQSVNSLVKGNYVVSDRRDVVVV